MMAKKQAIELAKKAKTLEEITEAYKLLKKEGYLDLTTQEGKELFNILVDKGYKPIKYPDKYQQLLNEVREVLKEGHIPKLDIQDLRMADSEGWTIAHGLATQFTYPLPITKDWPAGIILMRDDKGATVAHCLANSGYNFQKEISWIYKVADNDGWTVAHVGADSLPNEVLMDKELLTLKESSADISVMHSLASNHYPEAVIEIIKKYPDLLFLSSAEPSDTVLARLVDRIVPDTALELIKVVPDNKLAEALKNKDLLKKVVDAVKTGWAVFG